MLLGLDMKNKFHLIVGEATVTVLWTSEKPALTGGVVTWSQTFQTFPLEAATRHKELAACLINKQNFTSKDFRKSLPNRKRNEKCHLTCASE